MIGQKAKDWYERTGRTNHYMDNVRGDLVGRTFVSRNYDIKVIVVKETNCFVDYRVVYEDGDMGAVKRDSKGMCGLEMAIHCGDTCILHKEEK